jgi:hypothetical protein
MTGIHDSLSPQMRPIIGTPSIEYGSKIEIKPDIVTLGKVLQVDG